MEGPSERGQETGATDTPDVPGYTLGSVLGRGGSGDVWSAVPDGGGPPCAVKVLTPTDDDLDHAVREAALLREIRHEHVLRLVDVVALPSGQGPAAPGRAGGRSRLALVLELAGGGSLAELVLARGHLSPGELVTAVSPVAAAMGDLHRGGVVHGDLSPGNVLFTEAGRPLLADLGVARIVGEPPGGAHGTAGFVAPEVLDGGMPSPSSDVYSLGALAWLCLVGEPPAAPAVRGPLLDLAPGTPEAMVEMVGRALAGDPAARPTADELAAGVFDAAEASPIRLAPGLDAAHGITYRIRAGAGESQPTGRADTRRRPSWRRALLTAAIAGLLTGGVLGVSAGWWRHTHGATTGVASVSPPAAVHARGGASPAGHPEDEPTGAAVARSEATPAGSDAARREAADTGRRKDDGRRATTGKGLLQRRAAASSSPRSVLARLVTVRAVAWRRGSPTRLDDALAPGSPALERDRRDLRRVHRAGARYAGLSFTVDRATVLSASPQRVRLEARVKRSAYRIVREAGPDSATVRPETSRAVFDLRWTGDGWHLADWSS